MQRILFGVNHTQVGAYMLGLWGMPVGLVEAAALHHAPSHTATIERSILTAVHVANVLAYEQSSSSDAIPTPALDETYLSKLGLPIATEEWRKWLAGEVNVQPETVPVPESATDMASGDGPGVSAVGPVSPAVITWHKFIKTFVAATSVILVLAICWRKFHH